MYSLLELRTLRNELLTLCMCLDCMAAEVYDESFLTLRCDGTTDNATTCSSKEITTTA